jgi:hypothetical protein
MILTPSLLLREMYRQDGITELSASAITELLDSGVERRALIDQRHMASITSTAPAASGQWFAAIPISSSNVPAGTKTCWLAPSATDQVQWAAVSAA